MNTVKLKNGTEETRPFVVACMLSLEHLMEDRPFAFYDLVMRCRNKEYPFFGDNQDYLERLKLVGSGGTIHDSVRNVVLSAVEGEGIDMVLRSPIADS